MFENMPDNDDSFNRELVKVLDISMPTAISRLNGESKFTYDEITKLKNTYNLSAEEIDEIFFGG
jgi:hypothetical protein